MILVSGFATHAPVSQQASLRMFYTALDAAETGLLADLPLTSLYRKTTHKGGAYLERIMKSRPILS